MLILVTGGRDYKEQHVVWDALDKFISQPDFDYLTVMQGKAKGADNLAREWCLDRGIECLDFPADWDRHQKAAGHIRNKEMIEFGPPDFVLAFPGGRGTNNMILQAESAGVQVLYFS